MAGWLHESGRFPSEPTPGREITSWSRVSRCNMTKTFCQVDYTPMFADPTRLPAMVTLTYPGDWLTVAPNGKAVKAHLKAFRKWYERAWGEPLRCLWKLEFQRRGTPHVHMLMVPPHGKSEEGGQHSGSDCRSPGLRWWITRTLSSTAGTMRRYRRRLG